MAIKLTTEAIWCKNNWTVYEHTNTQIKKEHKKCPVHKTPAIWCKKNGTVYEHSQTHAHKAQKCPIHQTLRFSHSFENAHSAELLIPTCGFSLFYDKLQSPIFHLQFLTFSSCVVSNYHNGNFRHDIHTKQTEITEWDYKYQNFQIYPNNPILKNK